MDKVVTVSEGSPSCRQGAVGWMVLVATVMVLAITAVACGGGGSDTVERVATGGTGGLPLSAPPAAAAGGGATTTEVPATSSTTGVASSSTTTGVASTSSTVRARPAGTTTTLLPTTTTAPAVTTTTGPGSEQGPALPVLKTLGNYKSVDHPGDLHYLPLFIGAQDDDGWIRQFVVDWGDGGPLTTYDYNPFPCKAMPPSGWPAGNYVSVPSDTTHPLVAIDGTPAPSTEHYYPDPGSYIVTVTVRSTACDGSDPQEGSGTTTWSFN
ncbi:MAG: hypothetical protein QOI86_5283 [Actinomycetota bacterium]|nr:hypothetical protein [Actinomycetota bacterium]